MPNRLRSNPLLFGSLLLLVCAAGNHAEAAILELRDANTQALLLELPLEEGESVRYRYRHSVEDVVIEEIFLLKGKHLMLVGSRSPHYATGHLPEGAALVSEPDTGWQRAELAPRTVTPMLMRVPEKTLSPFTLHWRRKEIPLNPRFAHRQLQWDIATAE